MKKIITLAIILLFFNCSKSKFENVKSKHPKFLQGENQELKIKMTLNEYMIIKDFSYRNSDKFDIMKWKLYFINKTNNSLELDQNIEFHLSINGKTQRVMLNTFDFRDYAIGTLLPKSSKNVAVFAGWDKKMEALLKKINDARGLLRIGKKMKINLSLSE